MTEMERIRKAAQKIGTVCDKIDICVVLGSGLGSFAGKLQAKMNTLELNYEDIPGFAKPTVKGHSGKLVIAGINGKNVAFMCGRFHVYEGHDMKDIVLPVRAMKLLGLETFIVTNAAGGVNTAFRPGDLMMITDHINLCGKSPLTGPNPDELGPRFPDMSNVYTKELRDVCREAAKELSIPLQQGVYCMMMGPAYETPAQIRMARVIGADAVGMSTVPQATAACHMGVRVLGISCITNMAAGILDQPLCHEQVIATGMNVQSEFSALMENILQRITK